MIIAPYTTLNCAHLTLDKTNLSSINNERFVNAQSNSFLPMEEMYVLGNKPITLSHVGSKITNILYLAIIEGYTQPSIQVQHVATQIYNILENKNINNVPLGYPMPEGGICFEFNFENAYYNIKVDNELDASFYQEKPETIPEGWDLTFQQLLQKLNNEF